MTTSIIVHRTMMKSNLHAKTNGKRLREKSNTTRHNEVAEYAEYCIKWQCGTTLRWYWLKWWHNVTSIEQITIELSRKSVCRHNTTWISTFAPEIVAISCSLIVFNPVEILCENCAQQPEKWEAMFRAAILASHKQPPSSIKHNSINVLIICGARITWKMEYNRSSLPGILPHWNCIIVNWISERMVNCDHKWINAMLWFGIWCLPIRPKWAKSKIDFQWFVKLILLLHTPKSPTVHERTERKKNTFESQPEYGTHDSDEGIYRKKKCVYFFFRWFGSHTTCEATTTITLEVFGSEWRANVWQTSIVRALHTNRGRCWMTYAHSNELREWKRQTEHCHIDRVIFAFSQCESLSMRHYQLIAIYFD